MLLLLCRPGSQLHPVVGRAATLARQEGGAEHGLTVRYQTGTDCEQCKIPLNQHSLFFKLRDNKAFAGSFGAAMLEMRLERHVRVGMNSQGLRL